MHCQNQCGYGYRLAVTRNLRELFWYNPELRSHESIKPIYELLQTKTSDFDPRVFLTPIMDTVMYGVVPQRGRGSDRRRH